MLAILELMVRQISRCRSGENVQLYSIMQGKSTALTTSCTSSHVIFHSDTVLCVIYNHRILITMFAEYSSENSGWCSSIKIVRR